MLRRMGPDGVAVRGCTGGAQPARAFERRASVRAVWRSLDRALLSYVELSEKVMSRVGRKSWKAKIKFDSWGRQRLTCHSPKNTKKIM